MTTPPALPPLALPSDAVWLITGTSTGIGASLLASILSAHPAHRIVALSRTPSRIPLPTESTSANTLLEAVDLTSAASIRSAFDAAIARFGRVDVVINNAGYGHTSELESTPLDVARELVEINFWAAVAVTREAVRVMRSENARERRSGGGGVIAQVSSAGGYIAAPGQGFYHASKWALEGFSESVAKELDPEWGIRFVIFEPGSVKTRWSGESQVKGLVQHEAYRRPEGEKLWTDRIRSQRGALEEKIGADARKVADAMVEVVMDRKGTWGGRSLLRLPIGADSWTLIRNDVKETEEHLDKWRTISESTSPGDVKDTLKAIGLLKE